MTLKTILIIIISILCFTALSCERVGEERQYTEITMTPQEEAFVHPPIKNVPSKTSSSMNFDTEDAKTRSMLMDSLGTVAIKWKTPKGWLETRGGGMRVVTFTTEGDDVITCTIVSLGGNSGGINANVKRWLGQLPYGNVLPPDDVNSFMTEQDKLTSEGNLKIQLVDLTQLYPYDSNQEPAMLAAIIELSDSTIYIKMTGTEKAVEGNRSKFLTLLNSLEI